MLRDTLPVGSITEDTTSTPGLQPVGGAIPLTNDQWKSGPCFSCGLQGHGVNRCLRMDVSFPLSTSRMVCGCEEWPIPNFTDTRSPTERSAGKRGMVWAERSAARTIVNSDAPDLGGGKRAPGGCPPAWRQPRGSTHGARWTPNAQGFPALGSLTPAEEKRRDRSVPDSSEMVVAQDTTMEPISPSELVRGHMCPLERNIGVLHRGMRPAGDIGPTRQMDPENVLGMKSQSAIRPLSVEAVEFSLTLEPQTVVIAGRQTLSSDDVAPVVIADVPAPTQAGVRFSAVAEVHASACDVDDDILVVQASEQPIVCSADPGRAPRVGSVPMMGTFVSESLEHSVQREDLDGRPTEGVVVLEPLEHSVPDVYLDGGRMAGRLDLEPLEHPVSQKDQTGGHMEGELCPEPLEHSVRDVHLDSRPRQGELNSEPLEHSVPDRAPRRGAVLCDRLTMLDPLEHSVSVGPPQGGEEISSEEDTKAHPQPACVPRDASESQLVEVPLLDQPETAGSRSETGEAVVVGAIGSAAPWFLTGWAHEVEIDFMIVYDGI